MTTPCLKFNASSNHLPKFGRGSTIFRVFPYLALLTGVPPVLEEVFKGYWANLVSSITPSLLNKIGCKKSQFGVFSTL